MQMVLLLALTLKRVEGELLNTTLIPHQIFPFFSSLRMWQSYHCSVSYHRWINPVSKERVEAFMQKTAALLL